ncbi:shikimate dehydrogenase [Nakamurella silvestris]|nr:shikimate dehydrogenase [Nakamurella silvestris]
MTSTTSTTSTTRRAAVLGSPISHSLSPVLHRAAYAALGLTGWTYEPIDCDAGRLPELVRGAGPEWAGFSVTMPGKSAAAGVATRRSTRVELLGVANTLYREDGLPGWTAENTDVDGIVGALTVVGCAPRHAILLGGGGTALAAVAALAELGVAELTVAGRRSESTATAVVLAEHLGIRTRRVPILPDATAPELELTARWAAEADLVISTVPAGGADHLAAGLARVPALLDAVYHPWPTALAAAGGQGRTTVTGLDMLLHQALRQVQLMTGHEAPAVEMRRALLAATGTDLPLPLLN